MFKKLGTQIVLYTAIAIIVVIAAIISVTLISFHKYNDKILIDRSKVGIQVLETTMESKLAQLEDEYWIMLEDAEFKRSIAVMDTTVLIEDFTEEFGNDNAFFMAILNTAGDMKFKTDSYPFPTDSLKETLKEGKIKGIIKSENKLAAVYSEPMNIGGSMYTICVGFNMEYNNWLENAKVTSNCDMTVFNDNLRYSTTFDSSVLGTPMAENIEKTVLGSHEEYNGKAVINKVDYYVTYRPLEDIHGNLIGAIFAGYDASESISEFSSVTTMAIIIAIIGAFGIAAFIFIFCRRRVTIPLGHAEKFAEEMLRGQLDTTSVNYKFADDEVGNFVEVLRRSKQGMNRVVGDASIILDAMAAGDFTKNPEADYPGVFEKIRDNLMKIQIDLGVTLNRMNISSEEVLTGSNQMAEGSQSLADGTTRQASAIEEISATIADVSSQIAATSKNAAQAGELSKQAEQKVIYQDAEIRNMVNAMNDISETSKKIENIIKTIEDIAFQTNILALNAAVEAARAGDAGKGFAVVADEVRVLASKSAEAATSTNTLISASIEAVGNGVKIALATADAMQEVKDISTETANLISEIATASAEQNNSIKQITLGVTQISDVIQRNSATAEETAASCEELSGQSRLLKQQVAKFKLKKK